MASPDRSPVDEPADVRVGQSVALSDESTTVTGEGAQLELWTARDAVVGVTRELGVLRARNKELELLIHQLRMRILTLEGKRRTPGTMLDRGLRRIRDRFRRLLAD